MNELQQMVKRFLEDRPTMMADNARPGQLEKLLRAEIVEWEETYDPKELADILIFVLSMAVLHDIDIYVESVEKIAFNTARYTADKFQEGDFETSRKWVKMNEGQVYTDFYKE